MKNFVGRPAVVRLDCGTENVKVAAVQYAFRERHIDHFSGERSLACTLRRDNFRNNDITGARHFFTC